MKVLQYSQHVLGVGHVFRSLAIADALSGHDVALVTGGKEVPVALPAHVRHLPLPALMMDAEFSRMLPADGPRPGETDDEAVERIKAERRDALLGIMEREQPDVVLIELFPFGRKQFAFELVPLLEAAKARPHCHAVCSVRDILVEKKKREKFEQRVLDWLNPLFDLLVVHADPALVRLDETFSRMADIVPRVEYSGYVAPHPAPGAGAALRQHLGVGPDESFIVASAGGGSVGGEVVLAALEASRILAESVPHKLFAFSGPYCPDDLYNAMRRAADAAPNARLERFATDFPAWIDAADLSLSMAGYNTTMNLLASNTYGLMLPFDQNREQRMRCERLAARGALGVLEQADLAPQALARRMAKALAVASEKHHGIDLDGAARTARLIEELAR